MLLLYRDVGQTITINDDIKVTVLEVYNGKRGLEVKFGLDAPKDVVILRNELLPETNLWHKSIMIKKTKKPIIKFKKKKTYSINK